MVNFRYFKSEKQYWPNNYMYVIYNTIMSSIQKEM